jgi:hypothetical protein
MLEELILEINASGYLLANLFQLTDTRWQANLRTSGESPLMFEYGKGTTPYEALSRAFHAMGEGVQARQSRSIASIEPSKSGNALLASLGLRKKEPIKIGVKL